MAQPSPLPRAVIGVDPLPLRVGQAQLLSAITPPPKTVYIGTTIPALDQALGGGLAGGQLATLLAGTGGGKSRFALAVAKIAALAGHLTIIASAELTAAENRMILEASGLSITSAIPLYVVRTKTLEEIVGHVRQILDLVRGEDPPLVVVDYLQLVRPRGRYDRRELEVAAVAETCAALARSTGAAFVVPAQLNRAGRMAGKDAQSYHARESAQIEQCSDVCIALHDSDGLLGIRTLKTRWTSSGETVTVRPDWVRLTFEAAEGGGIPVAASKKTPKPSREERIRAQRTAVLDAVGAAFAKDRRPVPAVAVAGILNLGTTTAREHLEALAAAQKVHAVPASGKGGGSAYLPINEDPTLWTQG